MAAPYSCTRQRAQTSLPSAPRPSLARCFISVVVLCGRWPTAAERGNSTVTSVSVDTGGKSGLHARSLASDPAFKKGLQSLVKNVEAHIAAGLGKSYANAEAEGRRYKEARAKVIKELDLFTKGTKALKGKVAQKEMDVVNGIRSELHLAPATLGEPADGRDDDQTPAAVLLAAGSKVQSVEGSSGKTAAGAEDELQRHVARLRADLGSAAVAGAEGQLQDRVAKLRADLGVTVHSDSSVKEAELHADRGGVAVASAERQLQGRVAKLRANLGATERSDSSAKQAARNKAASRRSSPVRTAAGSTRAESRLGGLGDDEEAEVAALVGKLRWKLRFPSSYDSRK